jgi:peptide/nickel transport system substrate-binding protein
VRIRLKYPWPDFLAFLDGVGPRVRESGLGLIAGHASSAPYEDVTLKGK